MNTLVIKQKMSIPWPQKPQGCGIPREAVQLSALPAQEVAEKQVAGLQVGQPFSDFRAHRHLLEALVKGRFLGS